MADQMTSDDIERDIEKERVALSRSLNELQRQISPDAIVNRVSALLRENGGDVADSALRQARANPMALALTGAGVAWLFAGPAKKVHDPALLTDRRPSAVRNRPRVGYDERDYTKVSGFRRTQPDESFERRVARAEDDTYDPAVHASAVPPATSQTRSARGKRSLRDRLMEGTEMMTDAARDRVIAAREAAIAAEQRLEARARDYGMAGKEAFNSQPLMGALVAFGIGALAGALLPRTRTEDRHLGAARDRAMMEAERIYRSEAAKLRAQAEALAEETLDTAASSLKSAAKDVDGSPERSVN
ncbi:DUF3618 domain-containing protein [Jannaschia donghaensis]|uniref:DUF3618 domain-containing protein n=1 Tax=Jannaschia donghaensis TaxID=420998 RepID=A0A0M6YF88_9RHOB|nr:DUF3618 domain-containing protein [Jannaschia donghaensis]CTQ48183.1 hypothetical protein JDO7802_00185 [Jannaschia donghaensis]